MAKHKVALIGSGFMGRVHAEALRRAGQDPIGMLASSADKSRVAAEELGLRKAYVSLDDLLNDGELDAVHVTTPNRLHYEMVSLALSAGKHVLCEKPLAMNAAESADLVRRAQEAGVAAGVNYNIRFYPLCLEAAAQVRQGSVGKVYHVAGSYVQDWLLREADFNWRVLAEEGGPLRAVADIGTHWLDLVHAITGLEVEAVCADLLTALPVRQRPTQAHETFQEAQAGNAATKAVDVETEDQGGILLRFRGGARGTLWVSQVTAGRKNCLRFEVAGSQQALAWNSESPNELWIGHRDQANQTLLRDPALLTPTASAHAGYPGGHNEGFADTFKQCFRAFYGAIERGDWRESPAFPTFTDGHREILLCEAILRSHRERRWVEVPEIE